MHRLRALVAAAILVVVAAPAALAGNNGGCSAAAVRHSVASATTLIWPHLLDQGAFGGDPAGLADALSGDDKDGNGFVCVKTQWGEALNPNSHYYRLGMELIGEPTWLFIVTDDRANAT